MPEQPREHRPIRSYVLRAGRLTQGQQRAFDQLWPQYGVEFDAKPLDFYRLFGNRNPVYLEIGFGNGESLIRMAASNPDNNYLGIEVHRPGVGHLLLQIETVQVRNLRVMCHDAVEVIFNSLTEASLQEVWLFFPDPWHKRRHNKRRILRTDLITQLTRLLRPGGMFYSATDWEDYARQMMSELTAVKEFENLAGTGNYTPRPAWRPLTRFEQRGLRIGHGVWDLCFRRR